MPTKVDYRELAAKLPIGKSPEEKAKRGQMFTQFDPNNNGYLSLAEIDKGIHDILGLDGLFRCKPAIMRAYQAARGVHKGGKGGHDNDYVERIEFRLLLVYLKQYFELYSIFDEIDSGDDNRIDINEFKKAIPLLAEWGVNITDPEASFREIDRDNGGQILFIEFSDWAIKKNLSAQSDGSD